MRKKLIEAATVPPNMKDRRPFSVVSAGFVPRPACLRRCWAARVGAPLRRTPHRFATCSVQPGSGGRRRHNTGTSRRTCHTKTNLFEPVPSHLRFVHFHRNRTIPQTTKISVAVISPSPPPHLSPGNCGMP